jgi:RES domain-containing protein
MLDLTSPAIRRQLGITLAELAGEDWRKLLQSRQESLSQALGRAVASTGASGLLVRSAAVRQALNVIIFPPLGSSDHLAIVDGDKLARLKGQIKA